MEWLNTRLRVLGNRPSPSSESSYAIGHPDPFSRLGLLTEVLFWITRLVLLRRLWTGEARHIMKNARRVVSRGYRRSFRSKIEFIVSDVNKSIEHAEEACDYILNKRWTEPKLSTRTTQRAVSRLRLGTAGLKLRLSEIDKLYVTREGELVVRESNSRDGLDNTPNTDIGESHSPASPDVVVLRDLDGDSDTRARARILSRVLTQMVLQTDGSLYCIRGLVP